MRLLLACIGFCLTASLSAQEVKKPKDEFPASGIATFKLRIKSIPMVAVRVNGVILNLGVDTGCQGSGVLTEAGARKAGIEVAFTLPTMGMRQPFRCANAPRSFWGSPRQQCASLPAYMSAVSA